MSESEFTSFNNTADNPWANAEMDVRNEAEETSKEVEKNEPSLANRIKNEMTLSEINELDIKNLPEDEYAAVKERIKYYRETGDAGPIKASANESVDTTEVNLPPKVQETKEKAAKHSGFNRFINNATEVVKDPKKLAAIGLTAMIATGAAIGGYQVGKSLNSNAETKPDKQTAKKACIYLKTNHQNFLSVQPLKWPKFVTVMNVKWSSIPPKTKLSPWPPILQIFQRNYNQKASKVLLLPKQSKSSKALVMRNTKKSNKSLTMPSTKPSLAE